MFRTYIYWLFAFLALGSFVAPLSAAGSEPVDEFEEELRLLKTVFTATKTPEHRHKSGTSVTVVTAREIRNMGARTLEDVLMTVPGIGITHSGDGFSEIEVRGIKTINSEKVLFMIDNIPLLNPNDGGVLWAFEYLITENIKKMEIIRGPVSGLYGANAFLAVINIITKHAEDIEGIKLSAGGRELQYYPQPGVNFFIDMRYSF